MHYGRRRWDTDIEDNCECPQEMCGLVSSHTMARTACPEHSLNAGKAMTQGHKNADCPYADWGKE